jgi:hypothetical protein
MRHLPKAVVRASRARVRINSAGAARAALVAALGLLAACSASTGKSGTAGTAGASASGASQGGSSGSAAGVGGAGTGAAGQSAGAAGMIGAAGAGGTSAGGAGGTSAGGAGGTSTAGAGGGSQGGSAGSAGAGGGSASLTLPIMRAGGLYVLEMGGLSFTVNPMVGARIISFKLDGDELLTDATANAMFWGSTLWTSPASDWVKGAFAAPPIVDSDPYTVTVSADNAITATSAVSMTTNNTPAKRFIITKVFHADLVNRTIVIDYKITNMATAAFNLSHWEVTRVFPNGLTFFPAGMPANTKLDYLAQPAKVTQALGYTWYDNSMHTMGTESKAGTDSQGGFIAHVAPHANGDLLFIKAFKAVTQAAGPPGENPIEWYCNAPHTYVELEDHSPYDSIAMGATSTRTVTWYLRRLPAGDHTAGSATLIAAVQSALGK